MNREEKSAVVESIAERIKQSEAILAVDYRGIDVGQIAQLRADLRAADATFHIVKNTLAKRAAASSGSDRLTELLIGPTAFTYIRGDIALAAKSLNKFARDEKVIEFKGGMMESDVLTVEQIQEIAKLPALATLKAQLVGTVSSPLTTLARGLGSMIGGLAIALAQLEEKKTKEVPAEAEVSPEPEAEVSPEPEAEVSPEPEAEVSPEPEAEVSPEPEAEEQEHADDEKAEKS